jgi:MFS-type transporter involved in bile tolerance (Atg22 family)
MEQSEEYHEAKRKVTKLRGFYRQLGLFVIINAVLIILNLIMSPGNFWFYWVTLFWGIAIVWQAYDVFGNRMLGKEWEEKKIQEYMEKKK